MSSPEDRGLDADQEMGSGRETFRGLGVPQSNEASRYRALAVQARQAGDDALADRFINYVSSIEDDYVARQIESDVDFARNAIQRLTGEDSGSVFITAAFPGGHLSEARLAGLRGALLDPEGLKNAVTETVEGPEGRINRYVVPLRGGMRYIETYLEDHEITEVEIEK